MNARVSIFAAIALAGCSTQPPPPAVSTVNVPNFFELPPQPPSPLPPARICRLGTSCMALDSRPFETCLLGSKSCGDKLGEYLQVERPKVIMRPAPR